MSITLKRPLVEMHSRLCDIPIEWLRSIEPKIQRAGFLPCWMWAGAVDGDGYPIMKEPGSKKGALVKVRPYVAHLFWDFPRGLKVRTSCRALNCVNPRHLIVVEPLVRNRGPRPGSAPAPLPGPGLRPG